MIADHGNNADLLLDQIVERDDWARLDKIEVSVAIEGHEAGRATTATMLDGPFGATRFLIRRVASRGIAHEPG